MTLIRTLGSEATLDASPANRPTRRDIQALRAVAVLAVVVYHLWPQALPGGFVGVDVFFVISGFLITTHLLDHPPQRARDLAAFWARRVQRLLPPVVVVILAVLGVTVLFSSSGLWQRTALDAIASMFYVENWRLIAQATDYLDAHQAPSPFQHFWSLSVEEQYYLAWPLLVGAVAWLLARRAHRLVGPRGAYVLVFGVVLLGSLAWSIHLTSTAPDRAYFSTFTRVWELAVGSVLAAAYPWLRQRLSSAVASTVVLWVGLVLIAVALVTYDSATPFPGSAALVPTLGAALVLLAHDPDHRLNPRRLSHSRPAQTIGDISYALYLWHWPIVILAPSVLGHEATGAERVGLLVVSLLAAWVSTRWVEAPVRTARSLRHRPGRVFLVGAAGSALVLVAALGLHQWVANQVDQERRQVAAGLQSATSCLGAAAMDPTRECPEDPALVTSPEFTKADITEGITTCLNWVPFPDPLITCSRGDTTDPVAKIALFGNSHGGHWLESLTELGAENHWQIDTYIIGVCKSTIEPHAVDTSIGATTEECRRLNADVVRSIAGGGYDLTVMSTMDRDPSSTPELYRSTLEGLRAGGGDVLVIRDTPAPMDQDYEPPDCVGDHLDDLSACDGTPGAWIGPDPLAEEAADLATSDPGVTVVDLNHYMCTETVCPEVIGGVIVHSDFNHLSKTFSTSLAPYLEPALAETLADPDRS